MMTISIIKTTTDTHLAHVYEHLFVRAFRLALKSQGLFNYLDYDISGFGYKSYILIEATPFTKRADRAISEFITNGKVALDEDSITSAVCEVIVEDGQKFGGDMGKMQKSLFELDTRSWQHINTLNFYNTDVRQKHTLRRLPQQISKRKLTNRVLLRNEYMLEEKFLPLFHIIATSILSNLQLIINNQYSYYRQEDKAHYKTKSIHVDYVYNVWRRYRPQLTNERQACEAAIREMFDNGLVDSIYIYLKSADFEVPHAAPDREEIAEVTGTLVGARGWHELADKEKILDIVRNMEIEIRSGKATETIYPYAH